MKEKIHTRSLQKALAVLFSIALLFTIQAPVYASAQENYETTSSLKSTRAISLPYSGNFTFTNSNTGSIFYHAGRSYSLYISVTTSCPSPTGTWNIWLMSTSSTTPQRILFLDSNGHNESQLRDLPAGEYYLQYLAPDSSPRTVNITVSN